MVLLTQSPNGALSSSSILPFSNPNPNFSLFSRSRSKLPSSNPSRKPPPRTLTAAAADGEAGPTTRPLSSPPPPLSAKEPESSTVFVGDKGVPLEGVIQFEKPDATPSKLISWAQVGLLAGGDVLCLLLFSAIGRFSHGFPVLDFETLKTADPFIAGWFLGAYFLGGFGDDGKGLNGTSKAVTATAKSWLVGIPHMMRFIIEIFHALVLWNTCLFGDDSSSPSSPLDPRVPRLNAEMRDLIKTLVHI